MKKTYNPFYLDLTEDEVNKIGEKLKDILNTGVLILGPNTDLFEKMFAKYVGSQYAVSMNSATSALEALCIIHGFKGMNVAVPTNTNFASVEAIIRAGGHPLFMDMNPQTFSSDLDSLMAVCERATVHAVMWVHIGGFITPDFPAVVDFCKRNSIILIEDCAHAHGSWLGGISAGNFAEGGVFSFFPTKVMTTIEGGMIVTNNSDVYELAKSIRNQGKRYAAYGGLHYDHGNSWRISEIGAYMGTIQLSKLDQMVNARAAAAKVLDRIFKSSGVDYVSSAHMDACSYYKYIVRLRTTHCIDEVRAKLLSDGIQLGGGVYDVPCHLQPVFKDIDRSKLPLANAENCCPRHICPPINSSTNYDDADYIAIKISEVLNGIRG